MIISIYFLISRGFLKSLDGFGMHLETHSPEELARAQMIIDKYPSKEKLAEQIASLLAIIASLQSQLQVCSKAKQKHKNPNILR